MPSTDSSSSPSIASALSYSSASSHCRNFAPIAYPMDERSATYLAHWMVDERARWGREPTNAYPHHLLLAFLASGALAEILLQSVIIIISRTMPSMVLRPSSKVLVV
eukprot:2985080-Pleurochrysis_carterae.AAC.1